MKDGMGGSLKFEAEFFRKTNNLTVAREKKIRLIQVRTVHLLLLLALALLAALVVTRAASYVLTCEALQVRQFRLHRRPVYAGERVAAILRRHGGNILAMDVKGLQAQLLRVPEIAGTSIRRVLPDTVEIDFRLRRPFYQLWDGAAYRLLDDTGLELGRQAQPAPGLVSLRGAGAVRAAVTLYSRELRPLAGRIEYVTWGEPRGIELKLREAPEVFHPGEEDFAGRIGHYLRIRDRLALGGAVRRVDLRIPGRIYIEWDDAQRGKP